MPEFLKTIPHEYILLPNIKGSDAIWGVGKNWSLEEAKHKLTPDRYITCCYNLKDTNYAVIDIDTDDYSLEQLYQDTEIDSCYVKGNTKGLHVWVEMEHGKEGKFKKNIVKCSNLCEMDYLGEKVFERVGKEWVGDVPAYLQPSQLNKCFKQEKFMIKLPTASQEPAASAPELLYKLINMVSQEYCDDRSDWLKIVYAMKKCGVGEEFARDWSKKSDRYAEDGFTNAWEQYSAEQITATEGTIRHYAKKSNPEEYAKLIDNYFISLDVLFKGALSIAECISSKLDRHLKWSNEKWFMFNKKTNLWMETKEPAHLVVQTIHKHLDYSIKIKIDERSKTEDTGRQKTITDDIKTYSGMYGQVDKTGFYSMITKHLKTILHDSEFFHKLDKIPYHLAFKDGIYNLRDNTFRKGYCDEDYITKTIPFDYTPATKEQVIFVKNVIFKICNCNQTHMDYYLGVLGQALLGDPELEKALYFCVGVSGNNGKTLIFEALTKIMPNYVSKIDRKTFEKGYSKSHKHLTGTKGKLIVYIEEMSRKEQEIEILKEIADGKDIDNEIMFGTSEKIDVSFKLFSLANCNVNMKFDGGIGNRYKELTFNSRFNTKTTEDDYDKLEFIQDKFLADKLKGEYKHALIQLLIEAGHKYTQTNKLLIPNEFQEAIANTLEENDEVKLWFDENCEYGEDFKCSKKELEDALSKPFKEIQNEIQRITNLKYVKDMRCGNRSQKGGYKGFRINPNCLIDGEQ